MDMLAVSVIAGMAVFFILHLILWRAAPSQAPRIGLLTWLAVIGLGSCGLTRWVVGGADLIELTAALGSMTFLVILYFFIYAAIARSVSVTLLVRFLRSSSSALDFEALLEAYQASAQFEDRLRLMHHSGLVRLSGNTVTLTPRGRALSRGARTLCRLTCGDLRG